MKDGAEANDLMLAINQMLASRSPAVQSAALAGMMAVHVVRSIPGELRPSVVATWVETVWQLVDLIDKKHERQETV